MTIRARCPRCDAEIAADSEDELIAKVRAHIRDDHGFAHAMPRKHILAVLRRHGAP
jgi:predicted small metal-binding protein